MAGTKNIYNSDPLDVLLEALERSHGVTLQRQYLTVSSSTWASTASEEVVLTPKAVDGYCPYVDPIALRVQKRTLLSNNWPRDMCYSGSWPIDFETFHIFMLASYGLMIQPGHWELVHKGVVYPVDESLLLDSDYTTDRSMILRTTPHHPLIIGNAQLPLFITSTAGGAIAPLSLMLVGDANAVVGDTANVQFVPVGGMGPFSFSLVEGTLPAPLNEDGSGLTGSYHTTGQFDYSIRVTDSLGQEAIVSASSIISMGAFGVSSGAPDCEVGTLLDYQYQFQGGLAPYRVHNADYLPSGLQISEGGRLYGYPDAGPQDIIVTFKDSLNHRFTLFDSIVVEGRQDVEVKQALKDSLIDWVELSAGYKPLYGLQCHPQTSQWYGQGLVYENVRQGDLGAVKLHSGYLIKTSPQAPLRDIAVVVEVARGLLSMGGVLFSAMDGDSGFEVSVDELNDTRLRATVWVAGVPYAVLTPEGVEVVTDEPALITVQAAEGVLSIHRNETLVAWAPIPNDGAVVTSDAPFTIGRPSAISSGYQWNGQLQRVMVFNRRLWADQLHYLVNEGAGRQYWEIGGPPDYAASTLHYTPSPTVATVGAAFNQIICQVVGQTLTRPPTQVEGQLPPGITLDVSNPLQWRAVGTPTQAGTFTSYWVGQAAMETKGVALTFVVQPN